MCIIYLCFSSKWWKLHCIQICVSIRDVSVAFTQLRIYVALYTCTRRQWLSLINIMLQIDHAMKQVTRYSRVHVVMYKPAPAQKVVTENIVTRWKNCNVLGFLSTNLSKLIMVQILCKGSCWILKFCATFLHWNVPVLLFCGSTSVTFCRLRKNRNVFSRQNDDILHLCNQIINCWCC